MAMTTSCAVLLLCFSSIAFSAAADLKFDVVRAHQKVPGINVRGIDHIDMVQKLNHRLVGTPGLTTKACSEFTVDEVTALQKALFASREPQLQKIYMKTNDNRRLAAHGTPAEDLESLQALWAKEKQIVDDHPELHDVTRDGKCHEAVMWWVHHIPEATKEELKSLMTIPLLAETSEHTEEELSNKAPDAAVQSVMKGYKAATSCGVCHASDATAQNTESKIWPAELSYNATGYGAFPFWDNHAPGCNSCGRDASKGQKVSVKYSSKLNSEILMHTSCGNMSWVGAADYPAGTPCNHLFNSEKGAFIYTTASALSTEADGKFCCQTYSAGDSNGFPGAVPKNWMRSQYLYTNSSGGSTVDGFSGDYYTGAVKIYWSVELGVDFWYYESSTGVPVEQGEGCRFPGVSAKQSCEDPLPILFYHDYDPSTFKETAHTSSEFELPDVCKNTTGLLTTCTAPGGSGMRRGGAPSSRYHPVLSFHARQAGVGPK
jgi:hypothetical protein